MTDSAQNLAEAIDIVPALKTLQAADLITPTGLNLEALEGIDYERCEALFGALGTVYDWSRWAIADLLLYTEKAFGDAVYQAALATGRSEETLKRWRWVGERVAPSRRRDDLSFSAHQEVAALPAKDQRRWLNRASREQLSQRSLHRLIREEAVALGTEPPQTRPRKDDKPHIEEVIEGNALPEDYLVRGALCRRLVQQAVGTGDGWVRVPRELINQLASTIGENPI